MYGDLLREMQGVWGRWPGVNIFNELDQLMPNFAFPLTNRALTTMHYPLSVQPRIGSVPPLFLSQMVNFDYPANYNCHSFMRQSVVSMSQGPDGRPEVYEETVSTTTAPGGIRETKQTVRDTRTGTRSMAIGHHIGERSHITARKHSVTSGEIEEQQEFINLGEEEAEDFNREWTTATMTEWNPSFHPQQGQLSLPNIESSTKTRETPTSTVQPLTSKARETLEEKPSTSTVQPLTSQEIMQDTSFLHSEEKKFWPRKAYDTLTRRSTSKSVPPKRKKRPFSESTEEPEEPVKRISLDKSGRSLQTKSSKKPTLKSPPDEKEPTPGTYKSDSHSDD